MKLHIQFQKMSDIEGTDGTIGSLKVNTKKHSGLRWFYEGVVNVV